MDRKEKNIFVYSGKGSSFLDDITFALDRMEVGFSKIDERGVLRGKLDDCDVLIIPGGWPQKYSNNLGKSGFQKIRKFVKNGGKYIGICAGAYLASKKFELDDKESFKGLGISDVKVKMEVKKFLPGKLREIEFVSDSALTKGFAKQLKMWYENGPMMSARKEEVKAQFDKSSAAIVQSKYGKGSVILFSPHPEGSIDGGIDPEKTGTIDLLMNAISANFQAKTI
jgi:glutamine amidotransferase-like uncharacterized protein